MASFEEQLVEHRTCLMRFARRQLRNDARAEDAVSETLLAAPSKPQNFSNRSQFKTWLVGILTRQACPKFENQVLTLRAAMGRWRNYTDKDGDSN